MDSDSECLYQSFKELCEEEIMIFGKMYQLVNHVSFLIKGFPNEHFEDERSEIRYNDQDSEFNEMERWFSEMNEQVNHVTLTYWESHPEPLNEEPRALVLLSMEEPSILESMPYLKISSTLI